MKGHIASSEATARLAATSHVLFSIGASGAAGHGSASRCLGCPVTGRMRERFDRSNSVTLITEMAQDQRGPVFPRQHP
jgi:hypothetical protein